MARKASRTRRDVAGGLILGTLSPTVFINGTPATVVGDRITPHGRGKHDRPFMVTGSPNVFSNNIPMCRDGDAANCGHVTVLNSENTFIN